MQWSPCSTYISMPLRDGRLLVVNTRFETVYNWGHDSFDSSGRCAAAVSLWGPSSTFMAAPHSEAADLPYQLIVGWRPNALQPVSAETELARALLAALGAEESLRYISWGPVGSLAAATVTRSHDVAGNPLPKITRLHVKHPDSSLVCTVAVQRCNKSWRNFWPLIWSPAGDRILLNVDSRPELVSSACVSIGQLDMASYARAVFTPDGRYVAGVCEGAASGRLSVKLWSASNGEVVLSEPWQGVSWADLAFNNLGNLLMLPGRSGFQIMGYGRFSTCAQCQQLCKAVALAGSWLDRCP